VRRCYFGRVRVEGGKEKKEVMVYFFFVSFGLISSQGMCGVLCLFFFSSRGRGRVLKEKNKKKELMVYLFFSISIRRTFLWGGGGDGEECLVHRT